MNLSIKNIEKTNIHVSFVEFHFSDVKQLRQEISALEELSRQLFLEAHDMHNARERLEWAATWQGKYFNFLGYFFSIYCMWKIFIVSSTPSFHWTSNFCISWNFGSYLERE